VNTKRRVHGRMSRYSRRAMCRFSTRTRPTAHALSGSPMAGHLARAGHEVTVCNRTASKAEVWCREYGGARRDTPADAVIGADIAVMCVGNDDDARGVAEG